MKKLLPQNIFRIIVNPNIDQLKVGRLIIANAAIYWFVFLIWPGETLSRETYAGMRFVLAGDNLWAMVYLIIGVSQYIRIEIWVGPSLKALWIDTFTAFIWTFSVISMLCSIYPLPAAIAGEASVMMMALWLWIHAKLEYEDN